MARPAADLWHTANEYTDARRAKTGPVGVTLRDVAVRAGVSVKTVSNVVHDFAHVRPETRARVQRALADLNYQPNVSARNLRRGRSGIISLALPELEVPYFAELAQLVIAAAEEREWTVLIDQTEGRADRERRVAGGVRDQLIDGLIFSPAALGAAELTELFNGSRTPLVLLGERVHNWRADHVAIDNVAAAKAATLHLAGLGRRRIAAVGSQRATHDSAALYRYEGYRAGITESGMRLDPTLVVSTSSLHRADGASAMQELLALPAPPDAVFCFTDLLALGAMRTLADFGLRVPDDMAVVGFDDIEDGRFSIPTLTTVSPNKAEIARIAVSYLIDQIEGRGDQEPRECLVDYSLLVRESTVGREGRPQLRR